MTLWRLDKRRLAFPDPHSGEPDGLLAVGGDLSVERLLLAYSSGIFPWYSFRDQEEILWYCPMDRFVIFPSRVHVSHSMRALIHHQSCHVTFNRAFDQVIEACSQAGGRDSQQGAWLGPEMIRAYRALHRRGFASSVEVWQSADANDPPDGGGLALVGGLYGVSLGRAFFGESMFSLRPSASKLALIALARLMGQKGGTMIDCQFETPHLKSMGGEHIGYDAYMEILEGSLTWVKSKG